MYDLEDNIVGIFETTVECAKFFHTSKNCIECYLCRQRKGIIKKKRDIKEKKWYTLYRINDENKITK